MSTSIQLSKENSIQVTSAGAKISPETTQKEWVQAIKSLRSIKEAYLLATADLVRFGKKKFGDEFVDSNMEQMQFDLADANKAIGISNLSYTFRANHKLTAEHHYTLSQLATKPEQEKWANLATQHNLTPIELKKSIAAGEVLTTKEIATTTGSNSGIRTIEGIVFNFNQWEKNLGGIDSIKQLPEASRRELIKKLEPLLNLAEGVALSLPED